MTLFSTLKRNSRLALRNDWGRAILVLLIPTALSAVLSMLLWMATRAFVDPVFQNPTMEPPTALTPAALAGLEHRILLLGIFGLLGYLVKAPLHLGVCHWFRALVHGKSLPVSSLFRFFESFSAFRRAVWFSINLNVRCILWSLLFFSIPGGLATISTWYISQGGERATLMLSTMGVCLSAVIGLLSCVLYLVFMNRYILAAYLLCEEDAPTVGAALKTSIAYTKGYRLSFFLFGLTFLGWLLLSSLTLGLAAIYTAPYISAAYAMYARYIIEKNRYVPPNATREFVVEQPEPAEPQDSQV